MYILVLVLGKNTYSYKSTQKNLNSSYLKVIKGDCFSF